MKLLGFYFVVAGCNFDARRCYEDAMLTEDRSCIQTTRPGCEMGSMGSLQLEGISVS